MYPVTRISPHNTIPLRFDHLLNLVPNLAERQSRLADRDGRVRRRLGSGHEVCGFLVDLANRIRRVEIPVETAVVYKDQSA
jgi:hypothetical protein